MSFMLMFLNSILGNLRYNRIHCMSDIIGCSKKQTWTVILVAVYNLWLMGQNIYLKLKDNIIAMESEEAWWCWWKSCWFHWLNHVCNIPSNVTMKLQFSFYCRFKYELSSCQLFSLYVSASNLWMNGGISVTSWYWLLVT